MKTKDEICKYCEGLKSKKCTWVCPLITHVNGKNPLKEGLALDLHKSLEIEYQNVNEIIHELMENRRMAYETISLIPDYRERLICAGIWVGISKRDLGKLLNISKRRIYQIIKGK